MATIAIGTWDEDGALHVSTDDEANAVSEHIGEDFPVYVLM